MAGGQEKVQPTEPVAKSLSLRDSLRIVLKDEQTADYYTDVLADLKEATRGNFTASVVSCVDGKERPQAILLYLHWGSHKESGLVFGISEHKFVLKRQGSLEPKIIKGLRLPANPEQSVKKHIFTDGRRNIEVAIGVASSGGENISLHSSDPA